MNVEYKSRNDRNHFKIKINLPYSLLGSNGHLNLRLHMKEKRFVLIHMVKAQV